MRTLIVDSNNISLAEDLIHDCWFSLDELVIDDRKATIEIPFEKEFYEERRLVSGGLLKTVEFPVFRCHLVLHDVASYEIRDSEGIGRYNFGDIDFDSRKNQITFCTGIPMKFVVNVTKLNIEIWRDEFPLRVESQKTLFL